MKKLFTMLVATVCATMAYAQTDAISLNDVTIAKGGTQQVEVAINNAASKTAFQFDLALPTGVTVKEAKLNGTYGTSRHLEKGTVDGKMRFLSYDDANALLADGAKVLVTLEAAAEAETATLTAGGIVVVDPEAASVGDGQTASATITVSSDVSIPLSSIGSTTFICDRNLDFSSLSDVKAYICTGYDLSSDIIYFSRVKDVPANTPIYVTGPANETVTVPTGTSITYYGENFLVGDAKNPMTVPAETDEYLCWALGKTQGWVGRPTGMTLDAGKAYLKLPKQVTKSSISGGNVEITMSQTGNLAYVCKDDLNFTDVEGLKAYIVMGFDSDGTVWISRVKTATAGTPLYLRGSNNQKYSVPSIQGSIVYTNMLRGDAANASEVKKEYVVEGVNYVTWIYSKNSGKWGPLGSDQSAFPAGTAYLPLLSSYAKESATTRGITSRLDGAVEREVEVLAVKLTSLNGVNDGATGISRVAAEAGNDTWYNLNGQRIDTPTKKGLYIKNGKKVIVK